MARFTSSQGNFTWTNESGTPVSHPNWAEPGDKIEDYDINQIKDNTDWLLDNLETCFNENSALYTTRYNDYKGNNYTDHRNNLYSTEKVTFNSSLYTTRDTTRDTTHKTTYRNGVNSTYKGVYCNTLYSTDRWGWGSCSSKYSIYHNMVYSNKYSTNNSTQCDPHGTSTNTAVYSADHTSVNAAQHTTQYSNKYTTDNATVNGTVYSSNQ